MITHSNTRGMVNYLLWPLSAIFYVVAVFRKWLYKIGILRVHHFQVPVVVVGNISVGGTGKTPIVMAMVKHFKQGKKVGVVSRGYGGSHQSGSLWVDGNTAATLCGDEPLLIALECDIPVMVNKNRVQAVQDLLEKCALDLIISDDGLQHYAMGRRVEIAVVEATRRFGNGFLLPAGVLREPVSRLQSVDFVINNGGVRAGEFSAQMRPQTFVNLKTKAQKPLDFFKGKRCYAVAGIGNPQRFFDTLQHLGVSVEPHIFADHHHFTAEDLHFNEAYPLIMTAKDCVKCRAFATETMWYLQANAELSDDFLTQLDAKL